MPKEKVVEYIVYDGECRLSKIKKGKLKKMLKEALKIEEKLKDVLIEKLKEIETKNHEGLLKRFVKKTRKLKAKDFKEEGKKKELLAIISKKDWKKIENLFGDEENIDDEKIYSFIKNMTFKFVLNLQNELKGRSCEVDEELEEVVERSKINTEKVFKK